VQIAILHPTNSTGSGFDAKFKTYTSHLRILATDTDYTYALILECLDETLDPDLPCQHPQAVLWGRVKDAVIPPKILAGIFDTVSDQSCLYPDEFVPPLQSSELISLFD